MASIAFQTTQSKWMIPAADNVAYYLYAATARQDRERAYSLAYRVYRDLGYLASSERKMHACAYDLRSDTLTILAEDSNGKDVGTITLVFDSAEGLPSDEIYQSEVSALRRRGVRLAEAVRFCIDHASVSSPVLMRCIVNATLLYASRVGLCDYLINECNPHHQKFYERKLHFQQIGSERPCPRVKGSPAVLLALDLALYQQQIRLLGGTYAQAAAGVERTLYPQFCTTADEEVVAAILSAQQQGMSSEDAVYFGLKSAKCDMISAA